MSNERVATCAERIVQALSIRGMNQADLRRLTKIPKSSMSQYISGDYEPKQDRIYSIAKALNVSEAWLIGYDVPMEREKKLPNDEKEGLTEGERALLDLFSRIPKDKQNLAIQMIRVVLNSQE